MANTKAGITLSRVGGGVLLLSVLLFFLEASSRGFSIPDLIVTTPVALSLILDAISASALFGSSNGVTMIVAGVIGIVSPLYVVGGFIGLIGGILGLAGGIVTLTTAQPKAPSPAPTTIPTPAPAPTAPAPLPSPQQPQAATPCPTCGGPLTYISEYQRWYCYRCQKYA